MHIMLPQMKTDNEIIDTFNIHQYTYTNIYNSSVLIV